MKIKKATALAMSTMITLTTIMPGVSYATENIVENVKDSNKDEINIADDSEISKKYNVNFNIKDEYGKFIENSYSQGKSISTKIIDGGKTVGKLPTIRLNKGYVFMGWTDQEGAIYTSNKDIENLSIDKDYTFNVYAKKITGKLLTEFKDVKLRQAINRKLEYMDRQKPLDIEIPEGYEYPLFTTDMENIKSIDTIHISSIVMGDENQLITSLDGIENLENLKKLTVYRGDLGDLDLSKLENLEELTIEDANVTSIKLPKPYYGKGLRSIKLSGNKIENIDLQGLKFLEEVDIKEENLKKINTEGLIRLEDLRIRDAKNLNSLDTYDLRPIKELRLDNCGFTEFDTSNMVKLTNLSLINNNLKDIVIPETSNITHIDLSGNNIKDLKLDSKKIMEVEANYNPIEKIEIASPELYHLSLKHCNLENLDVKKFDKLKYLYVSNVNEFNAKFRNKIKSLDLTENKELVKLYAENNFIKNIDLENNEKLLELNLENNGLEELKVSDKCELASAVSGNFNIKNNSLTKFVYTKGDTINAEKYIEPQTRVVKPMVKNGKTYIDMKALLGDDYNLLDKKGAYGGYIDEDGKFYCAKGTEKLTYRIHSGTVNGPLMTVQLNLSEKDINKEGAYIENLENIYIEKGSDLKDIKLPETINIIRKDGKTEKQEVKWDTKDLKTDSIKDIQISGEVKGNRLNSELTVKVVEVKPFEKVVVGKGGLDVLPKEAIVITENGEEKLPVKWESQVDFSKIGVQEIEGNIAGLKTVKLEVEVSDEEAYILDIPDINLRKAIVNQLGYFRAKKPENVKVPKGYEYPVFSTDFEKMKNIKYLSITGEKTIVNGRVMPKLNNLKGIEYLENLEGLAVKSTNFSFEQTKPELKKVDLSNNHNLKRVDFSGIGIEEITFGKVENLEYLDLSRNNLKSLELGEASKLKDLIISDNNIETLKIKNAPSINKIWATNNEISEIDLTGLTNIYQLNLVNNNLHGEIDLTVLTKLHDTNLSNNKITNIKAQGLEELVAITANNNNLKNIEVDKTNKTLYSVTVNNNDIESLKLNLPVANRVEMKDNKLSDIDLSKLPKLETLYLSNINGGSNTIKNIDISKNKELLDLRLSNVGLEKIDLNSETLRTLYADNNKLEKVNLKSSPKIKVVHLSSNNISEIILPKMTANKFGVMENTLNELYVNYNNLKELDIADYTSVSTLQCAYNKLTNLEFKKDNIAGRTNPVFSPQVIEIEPEEKDGQKVIDLEKLGVKDINKISSVKGGKLEGNSIILDKDATSASYIFNTDARGFLGEGKLPDTTMTVYFNIDGKGKEEIEEDIKKEDFPVIETEVVDKNEEIENNETEDKTEVNKDENKQDIKEEKSAKIERVSGKTRYETATKISKKLYSTADTVVLAEGTNYVDALTSSPYAKSLSAPLLYVTNNSIPEDVKEELNRLEAKNILLIGGDKTIDNSVHKALEAEGYKVDRISGKDRYETSAKVAKEFIKLSGNKEIFVSDGTGADALSISAVAAKEERPIVLVDKTMGTEVESVVKDASNVTIIGGENSIDEEMEKCLKEHSTVTERIAGKDRYDTSEIVLNKYYKDADNLVIASGEELSDALVGGQVATAMKTGILLVNKNSQKEIKDKKNVFILGGENIISDNIIK